MQQFFHTGSTMIHNSIMNEVAMQQLFHTGSTMIHNSIMNEVGMDFTSCS